MDATTAIQWALSRAQASHGCLIRYLSRTGQAVTLRATLGQSATMADDGVNGVTIEHSERDFLVDRTRLAIAGRYYEPADGDQVEILDGSYAGQVYRVLPIAGGKCFRETIGLLRIHAKRVSSTNAFSNP
jgi:hypothetical protein